MHMRHLPWPVSLFDCVVAQEDSCVISALDLWFLSDLTLGNIGDMELTLHGSQAVLLPQPLWQYYLFLQLLHFMLLANWKLTSAFFSLIFIVRLLIQSNRRQLSTRSITFYWFSYSCRIIADLRYVSPEVADVGIIGECPEDAMSKHSSPYRYIHSSDICNLPQQLGHLIYSDHSGCFQNFPGLGENNYSVVLYSNLSHEAE